MKLLAGFAALSLLFLVGCGTPTRARFQVHHAGGTGEPPRVTVEDRERVREALAAVAAQMHLSDFASTSLVPETVAYYQRADTQTPIKLFAWIEENQLFVELAQAPDGAGESLAYRRARDLLQKELDSRFHERWSIVSLRELRPQHFR